MFAAIASLVLVSASVLAGASDCTRSYIVQKGDWCDTISARYNTPTYQLAYANQDVINECCTNLQVGQRICLAAKSQPDCTTTHVVCNSDTCSSIAKMHGLNMTMIMINNPQLNGQCDIYPGQVLCVSNSLMAVKPAANSRWVPPHPCIDDDSTAPVYTPFQSSGGSSKPAGTGVYDNTGPATSNPGSGPNGAGIYHIQTHATQPPTSTSDGAEEDCEGDEAQSEGGHPASSHTDEQGDDDCEEDEPAVDEECDDQ